MSDRISYNNSRRVIGFRVGLAGLRISVGSFFFVYITKKIELRLIIKNKMWSGIIFWKLGRNIRYLRFLDERPRLEVQYL